MRQRQLSLPGDASVRVRQGSVSEAEEVVETRFIPVVRHNLNNKHILSVRQFDRNTVSHCSF